MNMEMINALIRQCEDLVQRYNVEIQTKEEEISELNELRKQYEEMEIATEYCVTSSRNNLLNNFPTSQNPLFLIFYNKVLENLFFEDDSEAVLAALRGAIETILDEIALRTAQIAKLNNEISNTNTMLYNYGAQIKQILEGDIK